MLSDSIVPSVLILIMVYTEDKECGESTPIEVNQSNPDCSPVGRSTRNGMPGLARPYVSDPFHHYFYAGGQQIFNAEGAVGNFEQEVPSLGGGAYHSLAELAVVSANQQEAVEVGWSVDPLTFQDGRPHLFVFYWLNGTPEGYDPSVFVHLANTPQPGQRVAVDGKMHGYGIEIFQGNWWIWYGA